jgi:L-fucose isomerase
MKNNKINPPKNRLIGDMPKIGIRPAIDGRRQGVRESLEDQTMNMAKNVAKFLSENLRHANGLPVECIIADSCIGGVAEAAQTAEKFSREGVGVSLTVTPAWCYGSETMDMDPLIPKAVWGFNGTERPGAVYLAAVLAAHNQKGVPAFGIYGKEVQDSDDTSIPEDVQEKLLRFARAGLTVATMRGKSYLSMGGVSMGIAGSIVDQNFFEEYLGMRVEAIDMSEFIRRINEDIYDPVEFEKALKWVKANCKEGEDLNPAEIQRSREEKDEDWEVSIKMTLIARDLMIGNPRLDELGFGEEALGRNSIAAGFQGQRQWTDFMPNGDFMEATLNTSFDWNGIRQPYIVATENDSLNGVCMLFGHLLTGSAQVFSDVRTYWSSDSIERVTGYRPDGLAKDGVLHLINSGPSALDGTGQQEIDGKPAIKPWWDVTEEDAEKCLNEVQWCTSMVEYFRGGGWSTDFLTRGEMPVTMSRLNLVKGLGPVLQLAEGYIVNLPEEVHNKLDTRTNPTWPTTWFAPRTTGSGVFRDPYSVIWHR